MRLAVQRLATSVVSLVFAASMSAQFQFPAYGPSECMGTAKRAITGATDAAVVAALTIGIDLPLGESSIGLGMSTKDGKSPLWIYIVRSEALDTVAFVPLIRVIACIAPPVDIPIPGIDPGLFGDVAIPNTYASGSTLITALRKNATFEAFRTQHPDSSATFAMISGSPIGAGTGTPISGAFWILTWGGLLGGGGAGGGGNGGPGGGFGGNAGLTCLHSIETGETFCFDSTGVSSVADEALAGGFSIAPNPTHDMGALTVPVSWIGTVASVEAVDATGTITTIDPAARIDALTMPINLTSLPTGMYTLQLRSQRMTARIPVAIVR